MFAKLHQVGAEVMEITTSDRVTGSGIAEALNAASQNQGRLAGQAAQQIHDSLPTPLS